MATRNLLESACAKLQRTLHSLLWNNRIKNHSSYKFSFYMKDHVEAIVSK